MTRSRLAELTAKLRLEVSDRRRRDHHIDALVRSRSVRFGEVVALLTTRERRAWCQRPTPDHCGRRPPDRSGPFAKLVDRIVEKLESDEWKVPAVKWLIQPSAHVSPTELEEIGRLLSNDRAILRVANRYALLPCVVQVVSKVKAGTGLVAAHRNWTDYGLRQTETPKGLPRKSLPTTCPRGLVRVELDVAARSSGGMGRHYPFDGYYLSLLIDPARKVIWDARGELTTSIEEIADAMALSRRL